MKAIKEFFKKNWASLLFLALFFVIGAASGYLYRRYGDIEIFKNYVNALNQVKEDLGAAERANDSLWDKISDKSDSLKLIRDANPYAWWDGLITELAADTAVTSLTINFLNESPQNISFDGEDGEDRDDVDLDHERSEPIVSVQVFYGKQVVVYTLADLSAAWLASLAK